MPPSFAPMYDRRLLTESASVYSSLILSQQLYEVNINRRKTSIFSCSKRTPLNCRLFMPVMKDRVYYTSAVLPTGSYNILPPENNSGLFRFPRDYGMRFQLSFAKSANNAFSRSKYKENTTVIRTLRVRFQWCFHM